MLPARLTTSAQLSLRAALAGGLAIVLAELLRLQYPVYALISAVVVTDLVPANSRKLALPRLVGTAVGTALGAVIAASLPAGIWTAVLGVFLGIFLSHLLGLGDAVKLAGYVCGIVLLEYDDQPWEYALSRMIETVLGIAAALLVSLVPRLVSPDTPPGDGP